MHHWTTPMVLWLGWACTSPADAPKTILPKDSGTPSAPSDTARPPGDTAGQSADTASLPPDTGRSTVVIEPPPPSLDSAEVSAAILEALAGGIPEPLSARRTYIDALDHRDAFCPGGGDLSIIGEWAGCTAASGWQFAGYTEYSGSSSPEAIEDFHLLADFRFHDPAGHRFVGGGELDFSLSIDDGDRSWSSEVSGTFSYAGATGWMTPDGASATLSTTGSWTGSTWSVNLQGAVTNGVQAVHMDGLTAHSETCAAQASGTISLRDPSGYWYDLSLTCGCGEVQYASAEVIGETCVDLSGPLANLAMTVRP